MVGRQVHLQRKSTCCGAHYLGDDILTRASILVSGLSECYQWVITDNLSVVYQGLSTVATCHGGPLFFKMGTRWGPNFQWNGDQMGTLASRMGTQEAHVCKIDRNKLIRWNIAFIRGEKLFFTRTVKLAWDSQVPVVLLQVITFYSGCMDFSRVLKP